MKPKETLIWFNNKIIPSSEAKVPVLSPTAQFGLNVFEGIRCYWNCGCKTLYAFRLEEHLLRLLQSCRLLGFRPETTPSEIKASLIEVLSANNFQEDISIRVMIFVDGSGTWHSSSPLSMFISAIPKHRTDIKNLISYRACVSSWQRINDNSLPPRAKVGANYLNSRFGLLQAKEGGFDFPLFLGVDGKLTESSGSCLFVVRNGVLVTPSINASILESITRETLIALAREARWTIEERSLDRTELYLADEAFLCGSAAEITPIGNVDGYKIGDGEAGEKTKILLERYLAITSGEQEAHPEWRTVVLS